jgi:hypothetical protein
MVSRVAPSPNRYRKPELRLKICHVCRRPFAWRKKWRRVWDEVQTCSERCEADALRGAEQ